MVRHPEQVFTKLTFAGGRACAKKTPARGPVAAIMVTDAAGATPPPGAKMNMRCDDAGRGAGGAAAKRTNAIASGTTDTDNTYLENRFTERSQSHSGKKEGRNGKEGRRMLTNHAQLFDKTEKAKLFKVG